MRLAILAFDGCMATEVFSIPDTLLIANEIAKARGLAHAPYQLDVIGLDTRTVRAAGGFELGVRKPVGKYDMIVVPGLAIGGVPHLETKLATLTREIGYLRKSFAQGMPVASICVGAYLLGEAGLLAGRRATTSWLFAPDMARRYPGMALAANEILVEDGAVTTTGAATSAYDLAIHLVKRLYGAKIATATARVCLVANQRVSQAPYVDETMMPHTMPSFSNGVRRYLVNRLAEPYDLDALAAAFHVSARTLLRRVKTETGRTPLAMLQEARVEKAKHLLASTRWSTARVIEDVGYTDVPSFSRLFTGIVGESPAKYRLQFR